MADYQRVRRIGEMLQREIAMLLQREIKDPRVKNVTISKVSINRDLSVAKVYYTLIIANLNESPADTTEAIESDIQQAQTGLMKASGYIRRLLGKQVIMRTVPRLDFIYDESIRHGAFMSNLIDEIVAKDQENIAKADNVTSTE